MLRVIQVFIALVALRHGKCCKTLAARIDIELALGRIPACTLHLKDSDNLKGILMEPYTHLLFYIIYRLMFVVVVDVAVVVGFSVVIISCLNDFFFRLIGRTML